MLKSDLYEKFNWKTFELLWIRDLKRILKTTNFDACENNDTYSTPLSVPNLKCQIWNKKITPPKSWNFTLQRQIWKNKHQQDFETPLSIKFGGKWHQNFAR